MHRFHPVAAVAVLAFCTATGVQAAHHEGRHMGNDAFAANATMQAGARGNLAETEREFVNAAAEAGQMEIQASPWRWRRPAARR